VSVPVLRFSKWLFRAFLLAAVCLLGNSARAQLTGNLIRNPGAEQGVFVGTVDGFARYSTPEWSWAQPSQFIAEPYSGGTRPNLGLWSPGPANRGNLLFYGGDVPLTVASQSINVSAASSIIDRGDTDFELSGWLGGYAAHNDNSQLTARFLNTSGGLIDSATIGPVFAEDRRQTSSLLYRASAGVVPASTRAIEISLTMRRTDGFFNNAAADNLSFVLNSTSNDVYWVGDQATFDGAIYPPSASFHDGLYWLGFVPPDGSKRAIFQTQLPLEPVQDPGTTNAYPHDIYFGDFIERRSLSTGEKFVPGGVATIGGIDVRNGGDWVFNFDSPGGPVDGELHVLGQTLIAYQGSAGLGNPTAKLTLDNGVMRSQRVQIGGRGAGWLDLRADAVLESPDIVVLRNGRLTGRGTINGNVFVAGGAVAPGNSPGTLTINGDFNLSPEGTLELEIGGLTPGSDFDQIVVNGNANLLGAIKVEAIDGFELKPGDMLELFQVSGVFDDEPLELIAPPGLSAVSLGNGRFEITEAVPEPGSLLLAFIGATALAAYRRRGA
jgi:hypothetical protein